MKPGCDCQMCRWQIRHDIAAVFERERRWLGMYQVLTRVHIGWAKGAIWYSVWTELKNRGLLIESFAPDDTYPRYLLARLFSRPGGKP